MIDLVEIFGTQLYYGCRARVGVNMDPFVGHQSDVGQTGAGGNFAPFTDVGSIMRLSRSMKNNQRIYHPRVLLASHPYIYNNNCCTFI